MSGARYSASGIQTLAAALDTAFTIGSNGTTAHRNYIHELVFGDIGTPADNAVLHVVQRCTALGTNTAVTPTKTDPADRAAQALCGENHTVEPTYTANEEVMEAPLNTRAAFRWVAGPGDEIITPAVVASGIGAGAAHASATTDYRVQARWTE